MNLRDDRLSELRGCVKVEVDVLGSPSMIVQNIYGLCGRKATLNLRDDRLSELRRCVKVEVDVLGSPSLIVHMVFVDIKQH